MILTTFHLLFKVLVPRLPLLPSCCAEEIINAGFVILFYLLEREPEARE